MIHSATEISVPTKLTENTRRVFKRLIKMHKFSHNYAHVRPAHKPHTMFCSSAPCTRKHGQSSIGPKGATFAEKLWSSKEDLLHTTIFISTIKLDVSGQSSNPEKDRGSEKEGWSIVRVV